MKVTH